MSTLLQSVQDEVGHAMDRILARFKAGARITVLVRHPGRPDEDFLMTSDDLDEVAAMVARRKDKQP